MNRKIRIGMVGGGKDAFIGSVHRIALRLDGYYELVAGSFSSDFENSKQTGNDLGLENDRIYKTYQEMAEKESSRPDGIDVVSIVTPNYLHVPIAKTFAEILAIGSGKGNRILFLSIWTNNFFKISLNEITSGPTHSIIFE